MAAGLQYCITGAFRRQVSSLEEQAGKRNRMLNGRQLLWPIIPPMEEIIATPRKCGGTISCGRAVCDPGVAAARLRHARTSLHAGHRGTVKVKEELSATFTFSLWRVSLATSSPMH